MLDWAAAFHDFLSPMLPLIGGVIGGAMIVYLLTATLTACSIPGVIIPISLTSGVLLGPWLAIGTVAGGALSGSLLLFLLTQRFGGERLRARFGAKLRPLESRLARYGPAAVVGLRVAGVPAPLVTAGASLAGMRLSTFAAATLAGLLPSVVLAAGGAGTLLG